MKKRGKIILIILAIIALIIVAVNYTNLEGKITGYVSPPSGCGDGICAPGEEVTCPADCPSSSASCGNGVCETGEQQTCPIDCGGSVQGIVSYWSFEGNADDAMGYNSGAISGNVDFVLGKRGQGIYLDGYQEYVNIPDSSSLKPNEFSIAAWVKLESFSCDATSCFSVIVSKSDSGAGNGYGMYFSSPTGDISSADLKFYVNGISNLLTVSGIDASDWIFVTGTYDGSEIKLYVNGQLQGTKSYFGSITHSNQPFLMGIDLSGYQFFGYLDEVSIYRRALTNNEVSSLYSLYKSYCYWPPDPAERTINNIIETKHNELLSIPQDYYGSNSAYTEERLLCYDEKWRAALRPTNGDWDSFIYDDLNTQGFTEPYEDQSKESWGIIIDTPTTTHGSWRIIDDSYWDKKWTTSSPPSPICGDGVKEGDEACDDGNTVTETCGDGTIQSGTYCNADCTAELTLSEQCDGNNVNCEDLGYDSGTASCIAAGQNGECTFDTSSCATIDGDSSQDACESIGHVWTGSKCCGDDMDDQGNLESYSDYALDSGNGCCDYGIAYENGTTGRDGVFLCYDGQWYNYGWQGDVDWVENKAVCEIVDGFFAKYPSGWLQGNGQGESCGLGKECNGTGSCVYTNNCDECAGAVPCTRTACEDMQGCYFLANGNQCDYCNNVPDCSGYDSQETCNNDPCQLLCEWSSTSNSCIDKDSDNDGVIDRNDKCPGTPTNIAANKITQWGCILPEYSKFYSGIPTITTNFSEIEDLRHVSLAELGILHKGKILFKEEVNVENLDLDTNIDIGKDYVTINTSELSTTIRDSKATITLYNISFIEPQILFEGNICSGCDIKNHRGLTLTFDVPHFSTYKVVEAYVPAGTNFTPPEFPCIEDWQCTSWSDCKDGVKTRTCVDNNHCGSENFKPPEEQFCGSQEQEIPWWESLFEGEKSKIFFYIVISLLLIFILLILVMIGRAILKRKSGDKKPKAPIITSKSKPRSFSMNRQQLTTTPKVMQQRPSIKQKTSNVILPVTLPTAPKAVEKAKKPMKEQIKDTKLKKKIEDAKKFVEKAKTRGYNRMQIRKMFIDKGWEREMLKKIGL